MGGLFTTPKPVTAPAVRPPLAVPDVGAEVGDIARRKRPRGLRETFLTGDLVPTDLGKARLFGGSGVR